MFLFTGVQASYNLYRNLQNTQKSLAKSRINGLPDSVKCGVGRAIGLKEIGLQEAGAAKPRNDSLIVVYRIWNAFISECHVSRRRFLSWLRVTTPEGNHFLAIFVQRTTTVPQLVPDNFIASGTRISASTVQRRPKRLYAGRPSVCVKQNRRQKSIRLCRTLKYSNVLQYCSHLDV